ncbi:ABC transporter permease [Clostridium estertheticum]|uniref:ABC transporter permease n=1 Tax=Clostridium estertheticum TaxID=238834 RepID=UPI001C6F3F27|nr:ABC transporter permease [Clostridium estertheticum]MBW9153716.1 ABC transporter permease [Clostridium estertheticum]WLC85853.1 ABC transporter permease [Clostridium estertheticum]
MISIRNILQISKVNLRIAFQNNILFSIAILISTPIIFSITNLDFSMAAKICEQFIVMIGVVILVPIFTPEEDGNIKETINAKAISFVFVYIIRILIAVILLLSLIALFVNILICLGGTFTSGRLIMGTFVSALFLGGLGLFVASLTENVSIGYMIPIVYFVFDIMTKGIYTKNLFLFSLMNNSFKEKYYLLVAAVVLIILSLLVYWVKNSKA